VNEDGGLGDLEDTITVPRLPFVAPMPPLPPELNDTFVPEREPPALVEPELHPSFEQASAVELAPDEPRPVESAEPEVRAAPASATSGISAFAIPPTTDTAPIEVPSPLYYRFRIGLTEVWLDIEAYIGRRPSSPRIVSGRMPRLVRVPSPSQEVSSTHLELRQLGASVVATDMRTTNGSVVISPGAPPRRLRQGESVVVSPGSLVDIGDGNIIEILPLGRKLPGEAASHGVEARNPERGTE
jgi:hypothetical protein